MYDGKPHNKVLDMYIHLCLGPQDNRDAGPAAVYIQLHS